MTQTRAPAVAGQFYPGDAETLSHWLQQHMQHPALEFTPPRMLILPHAGYIYSGDLAALGVCQLDASLHKRIIVLCPAHRMSFAGIALPSEACQGFATPLGDIPLDPLLLSALAGKPEVHRHDHPHQQEHAIEVLLPMLQHRLQHFTLLPIVVGNIAPKRLKMLLNPLLQQRSTLLIVSSDLSHYLSYQEAKAQDTVTLSQIMALEATLQPEQACGSTALNAALLLAARQGWRPRLLGQYNSGDMNGDKIRVVGYASLAFYA
ncbi:AmmeMemoRadiSam system protein B [Pseudaeromonas sharmana]|uniref:AmmeMemoRadiSam system protein B n=1 Tax=Pseudaeromonas sharmana TaxID=328412 RepID=A0ABV8CMC6_9GAMM